MNKTSMRTLRILDYISETGYPLTQKQICDGLGIPPSSAYDLINTMLDMGYLEYADKTLKTIYIGLKAFRSGSAYVRDINFVKIAKPYLKEISRKMKATAFLGVRSEDKVVYLDKVEGTGGVKTTALLGVGKGMYYTGLGKAILATLPTEKVDELYKGKILKPQTSHTICNLDDLKQELFRIRQRGYSTDEEEGEVALYCVAAPVRNHEGEVIAAISVADLKEIVEHRGKEKYKKIIVESAMEISKKLGYVGESLFYLK